MYNKTTRNIAIFDAEFTAKSEKYRGVQEMIQCALIVYQIEVSDENMLIAMAEQPLFVYKTFIKPMYTKDLSDYIKQLTGIKQEEIETGKNFYEVLDDIDNALRAFGVASIFTWGPDRVLLKNNCDVISCNQKKARRIYGKFKDVSIKLSDHFGYDVVISQHKACQLLKIKEIGSRHDAYSDATNLSQIFKALCGQICV